MNKIGIIGLGNMGQAIGQNLKDFIFFDPQNNKSAKSIEELLNKSEIIILAVKPQNFLDIKPVLEKNITSKHIIISIMAGVSLKNISQNLKTKNIVRTMPNLALAYQASLTGWIAHKNCSQKAISTARKIISSWGQDIKCTKEDQLNSITAAAGSGPAYFLMIAEQVYKFCQAEGFSKKDSLIISQQVLKGAGDYYDNQKDPSKAINKITSKAGTTEAAFKHFKKHKTQSQILQAIKKAQQRSRELEN